jgi:hypothetical protein
MKRSKSLRLLIARENAVAGIGHAESSNDAIAVFAVYR